MKTAIFERMRRSSVFVASRLAASCFAACLAFASQADSKAPAGASQEEKTFHERYCDVRPKRVLSGKAAYYGDKFAGRKTANGEVYNPRIFTAAHRSLPFGTIARVVRVDDGSFTYVRITDRGPFGDRRRILDVSKIAAERLHMVRDGVIEVRVEVVEQGDGGRKR